ncbi:CoA transferase [Rhodococcus sp. BP-241]|uniref:CaiB/BaiF CoA transferase family protein n=1 Tax=Rhodococcus sp. BP-241 TaxID=2739441 RepID=UPI001C9B88B6|nr:CaiB/BaiF CoA-transferase family protein [Rhodococcus sp. BP-241]MBY6706439.1 CoA transferase [Rhodococcus sp. BP-241]
MTNDKNTTGPLAGIRVIDLSRLVPGPYASMLLADLGADVVTVLGGRAGVPNPSLRRGKREVVLDLKSDSGRAALHELVRTADVLLEGFRPGVADRMGAGYEELAAINPGLIYCSVTGYGSTGPLAQAAGHDINYLALSGVLGAMGTSTGAPRPPFNTLADLAGGGLVAAFGIAAALVERSTSGVGQMIDVGMVEGVNSLAAMVHRDYGMRHVPRGGDGLMDGGAPYYRCYETKDGKFMAVGAIEDRFFHNLWSGLELEGPAPEHMDPIHWPPLTEKFTDVFATRTRDEWASIFDTVDACVTPVLDPEEARAHPQNVFREAFDEVGSPAPIPRFSRTPSRASSARPDHSDTATVLRDCGVDDAIVERAVSAGAGALSDGLAEWPPY